ncbi:MULTISPECIES: hypothetical protein [Streptomyces]|uniref:hypothetical protein n=1 Tax=Streptomyces TaxID=1883 RepID=UPI0006AD35AE|nr:MULTISPECIES: hypothetical protein [Streptomyces]ALC27926.1 hypothetical protein ABE83_13095 [Streptomyces sp. CFMR 7]MBT3076039.1 hypothetical protein [Streptomyces sp. COG21]MBT3079449.1 hypothetical protein [Streptomyces sp. COG20]MBT3085684.1 hypothetical protein [Streptomyces sp. CYG21]MBT3096047.1 hypothetical protein [Streptomyces sp. CBG30]
MTAESQNAEGAKGTAETVVPVTVDEAAEPEAAPGVTVPVTDPTTDDVLAVSAPMAREGPHDITRVASGEVVETVFDVHGAGLANVVGLAEMKAEAPRTELPSVEAQQPPSGRGRG